MNVRTKNLAVAGGAAALVGIIGVNVLVSPAPAPANGPVAASPAEVDATAESAAAAGAAPVQDPASLPSPGHSSAGSVTATEPLASARRSYAIGLQDLRGLPPDATPGTAFELWVTWEPPVTEQARLQRLIGDVVLERVIPGSVPEAPVTVLLSVPADRAGDLIYADTFGRLNVVLPG